MSITEDTSAADGFRRFLSPPKFENKRLTLQAHIVFYVNLSAIAFCFLMLVYSVSRQTTNKLDYLILISMISALGINLLLLARKRLTISLWSTATIIYLPTTFVIALNNGFNDVTLQLLYPLFIYIALFLRKKGLFVFGLITLGWIFLVIRLQQTGYYTTLNSAITFADEVIFSVIMLISTLFVLNFLINNTVIANDELDRNAEIAEIANAQKSEFLANMSHELRTPLNAIIGYSEGILEEADDLSHLDEVTLEDITRIRAAGIHLLGLINDVLDLSKIEADQMGVQLEWIDVHSLLNAVSNTVAPMAVKNDNQIIFDNRLPKTLFLTDGKKLGQILINLMSNAVKYTQSGEVHLMVRYNREVSDLNFVVEDTGIGIPEEAIDLIFESFQQIDGSYNRQTAGTGLGLAITKRFVELLDGEISVTSQVGQGTRFTVRIPTVSGEETRSAHQPSHIQSAPSSS